MSSFGPTESNVTLPTDEGIMYVGEQFAMDGRTVEFLGSGFAQPGVSVLGVIVPTGLPVDLVLMQDVDTGELLFAYPDGEPSLLGAIAMVVDVDPVAYSATSQGASPICFCKGTRIATPDGATRIEDLVPGDVVTTAGGDTATVLWAGKRVHAHLPADQRPIAIRPASRFAPERALKVSPQHRIQIGLDADGTPLLAPAKALLKESGVQQVKRDDPVAYHHILLDRHAVVLAEGVAAESLLLADRSLQSLPGQARRDIAIALDCAINDLMEQPQSAPAGRLLSVREAREYLAQQERPLAKLDA
ncbi:Hint domain-containing protein [Pseudooceanicola sp. MF1-13]|uniref:Hint domain-containing protein n=1 Tax=Pseudooceanicola sp. MF1-13 TaxID=3379095 RepID=UPI003892ABCB